MTPLRQLQPGPIPQCRFMVLEKRQSQEKENEDLWVADETASILLLDVPTYLGVEEGDLLKLQKGEVLQDTASCNAMAFSLCSSRRRLISASIGKH